MERINKKEKGITIISLVITIIILLILAGISIASITGNDGLIAKAKRARDNSIEAEENENRILNELERYIDGEEPNTDNGGPNSGEGTTTPDDDTVKISREEFEALSSKVDGLNEKVKTLEAGMKTLTTWESVDINISLPTESWKSNSQIVPELVGAKSIAVLESKASNLCYIDFIPGRAASVFFGNGIADAYNYASYINFDSYTGKIEVTTQRVGSAVLEYPDVYLPVFTKVYYKK